MAKGVRQTTCKFGARLEPLTHVDLLLWQGRGDLDIVNQVEVIDTFRAVREDLDRLPSGLSLLEVTDQIAQERHPDPAALRACWSGPCGPWPTPTRDPDAGGARLLLEGAGPRGRGPGARLRAPPAASPTARWSWSPSTSSRGHAVPGCRRGRPMSPAALVLLRRILGGDLAPCWPGRPRRRPTRWPSWPPRPWRSTSTVALRSVRRSPAVGPVSTRGRLRRLRARPVLPAALRLLRLRHLHRPRPPDGALRRRLRHRGASGPSTRRAARRPRQVFFGGGTPSRLRPTLLCRILEADPAADRRRGHGRVQPRGRRPRAPRRLPRGPA